MNLFLADYVMLSAAVIAGVIGLFIGFSGAFAFLTAAVISALAGKFGWMYAEEFCSTTWSCTLVTVVIILLTFGLVRWLIKKIVGGLLHQPADSIFGFLIAAGTGLGLGGIAVYLLNFFQIAEIKSTLVSEAMGFV